MGGGGGRRGTNFDAVPRRLGAGRRVPGGAWPSPREKGVWTRGRAGGEPEGGQAAARRTERWGATRAEGRGAGEPDLGGGRGRRARARRCEGEGRGGSAEEPNEWVRGAPGGRGVRGGAAAAPGVGAEAGPTRGGAGGPGSPAPPHPPPRQNGVEAQAGAGCEGSGATLQRNHSPCARASGRSAPLLRPPRGAAAAPQRR